MPLKRLCLNTLPLELGENTLIPLQPCLCSFEFDISSPSCPDEGKWEGVTLDKFVECEGQQKSLEDCGGCLWRFSGPDTTACTKSWADSLVGGRV